MALNCKPHDIALSVNTQVPENNGIVVRVKRRHINTPMWFYGDLVVWWCTSDQLMTWHLEGGRRVIRGYEGPIPDRNLRPIRPGEDANGIDSEAVLSA